MIKHLIIQAAEDIVEAMLKETGITRPEQLSVLTEQPVNPEHGEYSLNIAMQLAGTFRKSPLQIAEEIKGRLMQRAQLKDLFSQIKVAAPGFINLYLNWSKWAGIASEITVQPVFHSAKILVEHTSINPNKSAHIGHLRNACIGDSLSRMLKMSGHEVEVHNYIDDLGNQLADTVVGLLHTSAEQGGYSRFGDFCWDTYAKVNQTYLVNDELKQKRVEVLHELEKGDNNLAWIGLLVAERIVREHIQEMKEFGIDYDVLVWESRIVKEGFWERAFELLQETDIFYRETEGKLAGCWVLRQPDRGDYSQVEADYQTDKVLVRSNGILTYTAKDIAYHLWKFGLLGKDFRYQPFISGLWSTSASGSAVPIGHGDMVINVIDYRQEYPQTMVKQALYALGYQEQAEQLRHVSYGVVSLSALTAADLGIDTSDGKSSYPMSGRQGVGIKIADFLHKMEGIINNNRSRQTGISSRILAAASIRYYLLRFHLQTEIMFDMQKATELTGNSGIYLLYARSCSILDKSEWDGEITLIAEEKLVPQEHQLLRHVAYWPESVEHAVRELSPAFICNYLYELCSLFNHFYSACPILKAENEVLKQRVWLTAKFNETLHQGLTMLGLPTPRTM